ncbi:suppressor of tumorigenicity 14 protein homolog [Amblyraja radiata]|uniref:suppressor of tumorigenicity 14 protein homolog n=1 Tax=Amblyraja radiata TaxID=386614 RepID=UPI001403DA2B|nr:suppressor of tumorigenicity 14 protein homolog [Amblyraja radiata]
MRREGAERYLTQTCQTTTVSSTLINPAFLTTPDYTTRQNFPSTCPTLCHGALNTDVPTHTAKLYTQPATGLDEAYVKRCCLSKVVVIVLTMLVTSGGVAAILWYFLYETPNSRVYFSGSIRLLNVLFSSTLTDSKSNEFLHLAKQVEEPLTEIFGRSQLTQNVISVNVVAFSEGSVIAYFMVAFNVGKTRLLEHRQSLLADDVIKVLRKTTDSNTAAVFLGNLLIDVNSIDIYETEHNTYSLSLEEACPMTDMRIQWNQSMPCRWEMSGPANHSLQIVINKYFMNGDCSMNYIALYDSLVPAKRKLITRICSSGEHVTLQSLTLTSSGNVMLAVLFSEPKHACLLEAVVLYITKTTCGGNITAYNGSLISPNYPFRYPPNINCIWRITVPEPNLQFRIQFRTLKLEGMQPECEKDWISIDGVRYCGEHSKTLVVPSASNTLTVQFHSDMSSSNLGFRAEYNSFNPADGKYLQYPLTILTSSNPCSLECQGMHVCGDGRCELMSNKCDGWVHCKDGSDEINCVCTADQFRCQNDMCKPLIWVCDGVDDCDDMSDESNCDCPVGFFACHKNNCLPIAALCDGNMDCFDGTDETNCEKTDVNCTVNTYRCASNGCVVKPNAECDGVKDCVDFSDESNCHCGNQPSIRSRIVNGNDAVIGEWPWQISLHFGTLGHTCGATLINNWWLLSASHCFQDAESYRYSDRQLWRVYIGAHSLGFTDNDVERRLIKRLIIHEQFDNVTMDYDIALLELSSSVKYTSFIQPVCLPSPLHVFPANQRCYVTGWGLLQEGGHLPVILQKGEVRIINQTTCNNFMGNILTSRMMCAGYLTGEVDACEGDSGGPLVCEEPSGKWFQAGIVSWGQGCGRYGHPGVYTRITKFREWMHRNIGNS